MPYEESDLKLEVGLVPFLIEGHQGSVIMFCAKVLCGRRVLFKSMGYSFASEARNVGLSVIQKLVKGLC